MRFVRSSQIKKNKTSYICCITLQQKTFFYLEFFGNVMTGSRNSTFLRDISGVFVFHCMSLLRYKWESSRTQYSFQDTKLEYSVLQNQIYVILGLRYQILIYNVCIFHCRSLQSIYHCLQKYVILCVGDQKGTLRPLGVVFLLGFFVWVFFTLFCFFMTKYKCCIKANSKPLLINKYSLYIIYTPFLIQSNRIIHKSHWINLSVSI